MKKKTNPIVRMAEKAPASRIIKTKKSAPEKVVKKVIKKVANKKVVKKSVSVKKPIQRKIEITIIDIQPEQFFWVYEGPSIKDLRDLQVALQEMSQEQFDFHTKRDGNDFAKWIEGVFGESALARGAEKAKTKENLAKLIANHLK